MTALIAEIRQLRADVRESSRANAAATAAGVTRSFDGMARRVVTR
jgi:hypothetical protein